MVKARTPTATETPMTHAPHENTWTEQLWNVSLLPTPAAHRAVHVASDPAPQDGNQALRSAALLSLIATEISTRVDRLACAA